MITNFISSENGLKSGGTISGDVTIDGDLTVNGSNTYNYDELINGQLEVIVDSNFTAAGNDTDNIYLNSLGASAGDGAYGASIGFSRASGGDNKKAAIAVVQTGADADQTGLSFWTSNETSTSGNASEVMRLHADGTIEAKAHHIKLQSGKELYWGSGGSNIKSLDGSSLNFNCNDSGVFTMMGGITTTGASLTLSTREPSVVANDVLGQINFQAQLDTGADSDLVGASIKAMATDTFSDTVNATDLIFSTGASETATEKLRLNKDGILYVGGFSGLAAPELVIKSNTTGNGLVNVLSFRDSSNAQKAYLGFGSSSHDDVNLYNGLGGLHFYTSGSSAMFIDDSGDVGIGTSAPNFNSTAKALTVLGGNSEDIGSVEIIGHTDSGSAAVARL